ncbi:MAG: HAMP domain-containing histidine kinase [Synergistaceae bacterium]|nr:HAMP domain-containing sensor histidine kinase [Synergistota bacterium]NLM71463.1 HAMP domain-containing histidine kinase [Synergistaceae bacterium]
MINEFTGNRSDPEIRPEAAVEKHFFAGLFFLGVWVIFHNLPAKPLLRIIDDLPRTMDGGDLLAAASMLVAMNSTRAIALYLGWFIIGNALGAIRRSLSFLSWLVPVTAIPAAYFISALPGEGVKLHFGFPAVLSVTSVLVIRRLTRGIADWGYKAIALALFVFSFQWLDVIPALTSWGAGWGELSMAVKTAACLMEREYLLNRACGAAFLGLFFSGVITTQLMVNYGARLKSLALLRDREKKMAQFREESLQTRSFVEMQQLVHDLKRPLTTIMGLADVIASGKGLDNAEKHCAVIVEAGRSMEEMISEILHEDSRHTVTLDDLMRYVLSQVSPFDWRETVNLVADGEALSGRVEANVVRLSRAIVNLLDNAHRANGLSGGKRIELRVSDFQDRVEIYVDDEGPGFGTAGEAPLTDDWRSFSRWGSTGLGLRYVTMVVNNHGGLFRTEDPPGGGGRAVIVLGKPAEGPSPVVKNAE